MASCMGVHAVTVGPCRDLGRRKICPEEISISEKAGVDTKQKVRMEDAEHVLCLRRSLRVYFESLYRAVPTARL